MLLHMEKVLLTKLIHDRIATLENNVDPNTTMQVATLHRLQTKIETGGELLTAPELRWALDAAGEADNRRCRWIVYTSDLSTLVDTLNAMQVRYATAKKDMVNA